MTLSTWSLYDRVTTEPERSSLFYSMLTLTAKLGAALAVGIIYPILDWIGFDAVGSNESATLEGLRLLAALSPTLLIIGIIIVMWKYPLGREEHLKLRAQIENSRKPS